MPVDSPVPPASSVDAEPSRHAAYVGSFDPVTLGHEDIIRRGAALFDRLSVGIGINPDKNPLFTPQERVELMRAALADLPNVTVETFDGLAVDFARDAGATALLRGVRSLMDIEAELT
ncbi:MAG: pantetheine-phosphate adenylyltransferase, partial [Planctomycetota bacterium]